MTIIKRDYIYDNGNKKVIHVDSRVNTLKIQSDSNITYTIKGCLESGFPMQPITSVSDNGYETSNEITGNSVVTYSISGYSEITIDVVGNPNGKIVAILISE